MTSLRKFFIHYSHFVTGQALTLLLGLISFPLLTRILTREEYGIVGLVTTTLFFMVALAKAGLSDGIVRYYKEYSESADKRTVFCSTVFLRGMILSSCALLLYLTVFPRIRGYLNIKAEYLVCFMIMGAYLFIRPMNIIVLNLLRVSDRTIFYNLINLLAKITSIGASLLLFLYVIKTFYSFFIGLVVSELFVSILLFYWFFSNFKLNFNRVSRDLAAQLIRFGIPLLVSEVSYLILSYADRYMIAAYQGEDTLGLYSVGYNLASYISDLIMFSLSYAVVPIYVNLYETEGREKTEEFLQKCMHYLLIAIIPIWFGYFGVSKDLFVALASNKYSEAAAFSPVILLGSLLLGMNNIFNAGLYLTKKSKVILAIMLSGAAINILLNMALIPLYGVMGAAMATLAACFVMMTMTVLLSFRYIKVKISLNSLVYYLALSAAMYFVVIQWEARDVWLDLAVEIGTGFLIVAIGVLCREREIFEKIKFLIPIKTARQEGR